jgi:hypothetical protein
MKWRQWILYPPLIAPYPAIALYAQNARNTPLFELAWPLALLTGASVVLWLVLLLILREAARAALFTVLATTVFATVATAPGWVDGWLTDLTGVWVRRSVHVWPPLVVAAELSVASGLAYAVARMKKPGAWTPRLNLFSLILIAMPTYAIVRARAQQQVETIEAKAGILPPGPIATAHIVGRRPDIYYIILDGYARSDVMSKLFGFDNEPFLKRLEQKGFYVARQSTANYCQTPLSLSASLNAVYLSGLIPADSQDKEQLNRWTGDGSVVRTLGGLGYRFVTFATGFVETDHPKAEFYLSPFNYVSPFHRMLLDRTPLSSLIPAPIMGDGYTMSRERTLFVLKTLPQIASWGAPTFTFAHIVSPHAPFVFGENGEDVSSHDRPYFLTDGEYFRKWYGDRKDYVEGYRKQATYLTDQVERMIDRLLASSSERPVIILQSDHGSGLGLDTESAAKTDMHERMSILSAYYLPGAKGDSPLYPSISPVNSFRVVLNTYFDANLELLPDRCYFSTWGDPFQFIDVTDKVRLPSGEGLEASCTDRPAPGR